MTFKYYLINFFYGLIMTCIIVYVYRDDVYSNTYLMEFVALIISLLFYPLSRKITEDIALKFSTREFWNQGFFIETCGKSGAYAMYYLFCFVFSIPLGVIFIIYHWIKALMQKYQRSQKH